MSEWDKKEDHSAVVRHVDDEPTSPDGTSTVEMAEEIIRFDPITKIWTVERREKGRVVARGSGSFRQEAEAQMAWEWYEYKEEQAAQVHSAFKWDGSYHLVRRRRPTTNSDPGGEGGKKK